MAEQRAAASDEAASGGDVTPSRRLGAFVAGLGLGQVPQAVRERAKLLILDAVGCALASTTYDFARRTTAGAVALGGPGHCSVIGQPERLPPRDAAMVNGVLLHGLDFDDSHLDALLHATVSCLPAALAVAEDRQAPGRDLLTAYIGAMEAVIRIGASVHGAFHHTGFHATGLISHFGSVFAAGKLMDLDAAQLVSAQGIAASTAGSVQVFLEEGAWTKRLHPGWGAVGGITAATLARHGFFGPSRAYEGRFGLFETHLQAHMKHVEIGRLTRALGEAWELEATSVKPYPACHFIHGAAEAAIRAHRELGAPRAADIAEVTAWVPRDTMPIVVEPVAIKTNPANDYDAKFSTQFVVATCLTKGRFGLAELHEAALRDAEVRALAAQVRCEADPASDYPTYMSGGVRVRTRDGREARHHVPVNLGSGKRALDAAAISEKFLASAELAVSAAHADRIRQAVLELESLRADELMAILRLA